MTLLEAIKAQYPDHAEAIVANVRRSNPNIANEYLAIKHNHVYDALELAFVWGESPEGHDYWSDIRVKRAKAVSQM